MSYHLREIPRGTFGSHSKITEEYHEFMDAVEQQSPVLQLVELSDLIGAIEAYAEGTWNITLLELIMMKNATKRAFTSGVRQPRDK